MVFDETRPVPGLVLASFLKIIRKGRMQKVQNGNDPGVLCVSSVLRKLY
jgi:hypothetical protein